MCLEVQPEACAAHLPTNATLWSAGVREHAMASSIAADLQGLPKQTTMELRCAEVILELFCKWSMPACSVDGTPMRVCRSDCLGIARDCAGLWPQARSIITELESWDDCFDLPNVQDGCVTVSGGMFIVT